MKYKQYLAGILAMSIASAQTTVQVTPTLLDVRLFGWADLHAHPASHLAFGADSNGNDGIFWGKPGGQWYPGYSNTAADLPSCSFKHGGSDGDLIRHETHKALMQNLDSVTEYPHVTADFGANNHGSPSFEHWPHPRSTTHQQMHITQMRRAYEGGQRLMVASVTDNEFLSDMWTKIGYNVNGNPVPAIDPEFGYKSAFRQIQFIKNMANSNSAWMKIALSASQARQIIADDKLAIVLSLEIDNLTEAQVLKLVQEHGVRHVIPIHLVDNDFGGTAVYSDAFNAMNNFVHSSRDGGNLNNDGFLKVLYDDKLKFRLGRPSYPRPEGWNLIKGGAINIDPVPDFIYFGLGYTFGGTAGHKNFRGLSNTGKSLMKKLAKLGVMIDVAHMGTQSTADTLSTSAAWGYPIMDSHTGFRKPDGTADNERALDLTMAKKIRDLGGVIGFGTDWEEGFELLLDKKNLQTHLGYTAILPGDPNDPSWYEHTFTLPTLPGDPQLAHLRLRFLTGGDGLNKDLHADININGTKYSYLLNKSHEEWRPGLVTTPTIELPANTKSSKLTKISIRIGKGGWWSMKEVKIEAVPVGKDPVSTWLTAFKDALAMMGGKGMALGTDINGFAPQLYLAAEDVQYPIQIARTIAPFRFTPILQKSQLGAKTFDFKTDGIAHYGMLPDFLEALSQQPGSAAALNALFHSANDVVVMWEKCEKVAPTIN